MQALKISAWLQQQLNALPADQVVWNTMSGAVPAKDMADYLDRRDERALQWVSDHLRVMRHLTTLLAEEGQSVEGVTVELTMAAGCLDKKVFLSLLDEAGVVEGPVFWSADTGAVSRSTMLANLKCDNALAAQYTAGYLHLFAQFLRRPSTARAPASVG